MSDYTKPSLKKELLDKINKFINDYPEYGYRSLAQFIEDAVRRRADELNVFEKTPRFQHFNLDETGVKIRDREINRTIDIFFSPKGIQCEYCGTSNCAHIKFALRNPEIQAVIRKKRKQGWNLPEV